MREWQGAQRAATIGCTRANGTVAAEGGASGVAGGRSQTAIAAMAAAQPTGIPRASGPRGGG